MQDFSFLRQARRLHLAGTETGDADAARLELITQALGEPHDGELGSPVCTRVSASGDSQTRTPTLNLSSRGPGI